MAEPVVIYGPSGGGKSRSITMFGEDQLLIVQAEKKRLPTRKKFKYILQTDNLNVIKNQLKRMPLKAAVIDDAGYIMTNMFMRGHREKSGSKSFDLYDDIADAFWGLFRFIKDELPDDVIVYIVMHEDTNDYGNTKLKTIGKLLDNKVCLEGMVTICLRCVSSMGHHFFRTVTDGNDITKSPEGMFAGDEIDNDLAAVDAAIRDYYGLDPLPDDKNDNENTAEADNNKEGA